MFVACSTLYTVHCTLNAQRGRASNSNNKNSGSTFLTYIFLCCDSLGIVLWVPSPRCAALLTCFSWPTIDISYALN